MERSEGRSAEKFARIILVGFMLVPALLGAQQKELKVLFVGNSYTYANNLAHIVSIVSEETATKLVTRKSVTGGAYLREHWNGERNLKSKELIAEGNFDIVVLQDNSMAAINSPDTTLKYVELFAEFNSRHGAETYLFNTWARQKVPQYQVEIDQIYARAAEENNAIRVSVCSAWEMALNYRPTIDLFTSDGSHPSSFGTLLTACVFVKAITGELPQELPSKYLVIDAGGETVRLASADFLDRVFCLRIVNELMENE